MDQPDFSSFLSERMKERNLTVKRLSELSGIAANHLDAILRGNLENLPPAPYLRGYLAKLGRMFDFDPTIFWEQFEDVAGLHRAGPRDALPQNRFADRSMIRYFWLAIVVAVPLIYLGVRYSKILGRPELVITDPASSPGSPLTVREPLIVFRGTLANANRLLINGEVVPMKDRGVWEQSVLLESGLNSVEFVAAKFLGREVRVIWQILYEPPPPQEPPTETDIIPTPPETGRIPGAGISSVFTER